jgi:hypothetical protein
MFLLLRELPLLRDLIWLQLTVESPSEGSSTSRRTSSIASLLSKHDVDVLHTDILLETRWRRTGLLCVSIIHKAMNHLEMTRRGKRGESKSGVEDQIRSGSRFPRRFEPSSGGYPSRPDGIRLGADR